MDVSITALVFITLEVFLPVVSGCSPEFYEPPTLDSKTQGADIIVVGKVTEILDSGPPQPIGRIYNAEVRVKCIYKGGNYQIPKKITVGEAGFIYGMCESKDLEADGKYILFLNNKLPGYDYYTQSNAAEPETKLQKLRNICGLELSFPAGARKPAICKQPTC